MLHLLSPRVCFYIVLISDLLINSYGSLASKRIVMQAEQPTKCFISGEVGAVKSIEAPSNLILTVSKW